MLRTKRIQVNELCAACNVHSETVLHILILCSHVAASWEKIHNFQVIGEFNSFCEWFRFVFQQQRNEEVLVIVMVCWMLWKSRNEFIWNQRSLKTSEVVESAYSILNQWRSVQNRTIDRFLGYMSPEDGDEHWCLPLSNSVKVNSDAVIFEESNCYSYVFVVRDHEGRLIEARSKFLRGCPSADLTEVMDIREALSWVKNGSHYNIVNESDYLQIVQAIHNSFMCYSYLRKMIKECRVLLASLSNKNVTFKCVKWSANKVIHYLARNNCSVADRVWRVKDVHPDFHYVLSNDLKN